tara:strand:+ start:346 stop:678 length:333 start_codon:yes stop_codon:yes gene_type:complete
MTAYKNQNQVLDARIRALEIKKRACSIDLTAQLNTTYKELRPSRLLIRALIDLKEEPEIKNNLYESLISLIGGYLSKKIIVGKSNSIIKNILGFVVQYITTRLISKNMNH